MAHYLKYGNRELKVRLADEQIKSVIEANPVELSPGTSQEHIENALDNPIGTERIEHIVKPHDKICIIISDSTRSWQNPGMILGALLDRLGKTGVEDKNIVIISARGSHRAQTAEELRTLVTDEIYNRIRVIDHNCFDEENLTYLGTTRRGTKVKLNSIAVNSDHVILVGAVLHHFLAGFSGKKSNTVLRLRYDTGNHKLPSWMVSSVILMLKAVVGRKPGIWICWKVRLCLIRHLLSMWWSMTITKRKHLREMVKAHAEACRLVDRMNTLIYLAYIRGHRVGRRLSQGHKCIPAIKNPVPHAGMHRTRRNYDNASESREGFGS